ncbi:hypothetical protein K402DRAFT_460452 [Aulographum hederae CBS 113979]|uniref:Uncharacterized protein n=1 Tax=Aulographum hederae CBS 113979 TaxID=1176131 RepID=A0A6G1HBF7_9PEZI|nr:hypothetical protein K402DRAFT_460452 [Aulographum hederae CBS 113979]
MVRARGSQEPQRAKQTKRLSSQPAQDQATNKTKTTKSKMTRVSISSQEQLAQDLERAATEHTESDAEDNISVATDQPKHVRFSTSGGDDADSSTPPSQRLLQSRQATPHPLKQSQARRRSSIEPTLTQSPDGSLIEEHRFSPIKAVLSDRQRRRLRRSHLSEEVNDFEEHKKLDAKTRQEVIQLRKQIAEKDDQLKELRLEAEAQRLRGIQIDEEEEARLNELELEVATLRATEGRHPYTAIESDDLEAGISDVDTDMNDFSHIEEMENAVSNHESSPESISQTNMDIDIDIDIATTTVATSSIPNPTHVEDIRQFRITVNELNGEVAKTKAALNALQTELRGLQLAPEDSTVEDIMVTIRGAFEKSRKDYSEVFPNAQVNQYSNAQLLSVFTQTIHGLKAKAAEVSKTAEGLRQREAALQNDKIGLTQKLAHANQRGDDLQEQNSTLESKNTLQSKEITTLNEKLDSLQSEIEAHLDTIADQEGKIGDLDESLNDRNALVSRHAATIVELNTKVEELKTELDRTVNDHQQLVEELVAKHETQVNELEEKLATQISQREILEEEIDQKTGEITALELRIEKAETELEDLREQLEDSQEAVVNETANRREAEAEALQKQAFIDELEQKIEGTEETLAELTDLLNELRNNVQAERSQRERAEAEVDELITQNADIEEKLQARGIEANELKQKLFQVQMDKERDINTLQRDAAEQAERLEDEIDRRELAEAAVQGRDTEIDHLKTTVINLDATMVDLNRAKDSLVKDKEDQIHDLKTLLDEASNDHEQYKESAEEEIQQLNDTTDALKSALEDKENELESAAEQAATDIAERDEKIADLENTINDLESSIRADRAKIAQLEQKNLSLESRVNEEAEELLLNDAKHAEEVAVLKISIAERDKSMGKIIEEGKARQAASSEALEAKEKEKSALQLLAKSRSTKIDILVEENSELKERFEDFVTTSKKTVDDELKREEERLQRLREKKRRFNDFADDQVLEVKRLGKIQKTTDIRQDSLAELVSEQSFSQNGEESEVDVDLDDTLVGEEAITSKTVEMEETSTGAGANGRQNRSSRTMFKKAFGIKTRSSKRVNGDSAIGLDEQHEDEEPMMELA